MTQIPSSVAESDLSRRLAAAGLTRISQGKVRDTWRLPGQNWEGLLLQIATDRVSIYDFVLPAFRRISGSSLASFLLKEMRLAMEIRLGRLAD